MHLHNSTQTVRVKIQSPPFEWTLAKIIGQPLSPEDRQLLDSI